VDITISGKHVEVTDAMQEHIDQRAARLPRYDDKIQYLTVKLVVDSGNQLVEVVAKCHRADLRAEASSHDMYQSIDEAFGKLERQIVRHHDKMVDRASRHG